MVKINKKRIIVYVAVITLLVFLFNIGLLSPLENIFTKYLNIIGDKIYSTSSFIRNFYNTQTSRGDLAAKNKQLEIELQETIKEKADLIILEEENKILRQQLGFLAKNKFKYLLANVISRGDIADTTNRIETIIIDRGSNDGLVSGLAAINSQGIIIGKIVEVKENISKIYLTNNNKCKIAATVLAQNKTSGIAQGELGLTIRMDFIPQSVEIKKDDVVVTSGLEQYIPRGLVIGKIISINKENNELWQSAAIEPMVNPDELIIVSVITP